MMSESYENTTPYIPTTDAGKRNWFHTFAQQVAQDPQRVGLTQADADHLLYLADLYEQAYIPAQSAETRTPGVVQHKNEVRERVVAEFRQYAMLIKADPSVSDVMRVHLGIHRDQPPSPIGRPQTHPVLHIVSSGLLHQTLRVHDVMTPDRRAKPKGAHRLEHFVAVSPDGLVGDPSRARYTRSYTKALFTIRFDHGDGGKFATHFGRWATNTGEVGLFSPGVTLSIPSGGGAAASSVRAEAA